jgi:hypothetical protein
MVSIYRSGMNDHLVSTRRLTKQFPTAIPNVTSENRKRYFVVHTTWYLQSQTVWLPRLYPSILPVYAAKCRCPKPPKGVGFTDPLSGTLNLKTTSCAVQSPISRRRLREQADACPIPESISAPPQSFENGRQ